MTWINYISLFQESPIRTEKTLSLVALIRDGGLGGQIIIGLLFLLLLIAIYIYFERWFAIRAASKIDKNFMEQIKLYVGQGKIEAHDTWFKFNLSHHDFTSFWFYIRLCA